jgi:hypothetical protein
MHGRLLELKFNHCCKRTVIADASPATVHLTSDFVVLTLTKVG